MWLHEPSPLRVLRNGMAAGLPGLHDILGTAAGLPAPLALQDGLQSGPPCAVHSCLCKTLGLGCQEVSCLYFGSSSSLHPCVRRKVSSELR